MKQNLTKISMGSILILGVVIYGRLQYIRGGKKCAKDVESTLNKDYELYKKNKQG